MKLYEVLKVYSSTRIEESKNVEITLTDNQSSYFKNIPLTIRNVATVADFEVVSLTADGSVLSILIQEKPHKFNFDMDIYDA